MRPVENLRLDQWLRDRLRKAFAQRINVLAKIGMMNETFAADFQLGSKLVQVRFDHIPIRMHKGIETKNEIDRSVGDHRQGAAIIQDAANIRVAGETLLTCFDALARLINGPQLVAVVFQIMRPPPEPGRDFQNGACRQTLANPRKN